MKLRCRSSNTGEGEEGDDDHRHEDLQDSNTQRVQDVGEGEGGAQIGAPVDAERRLHVRRGSERGRIVRDRGQGDESAGADQPLQPGRELEESN